MSFKDGCIGTAIPVIDLIDCIKPGAIKYDLVFPGADDEVSNTLTSLLLVV